MPRVHKKNNISQNNNNNQEKRQILLAEALHKNKLPLREYGDQYSYVKYGKPALETVIKNEIKSQDDILELQIMISKRLRDKGISLKENINIFNKYIDKGNFNINNFNNIIKDIEINNFFAQYKNYDSYIEKYGIHKAQSIIINKYEHKKKVLEIYNKTIVTFD